MNTFEIALDVDKRPNKEVVVIRQDDRSGTTVSATLSDHGVPMVGGDYEARFCMTLPDRKTYYSDSATYGDGVVTAVIDEQYAAQVPGTSKNAYFELYDGDELKYTTASFVIIVKPSALGGDAAESYDNRVDEIMAEFREALGLCVPPVVEVVDDGREHTVTITCPETSGTFTVVDGYSPTVTIADAADRHTVTVTDADGAHSFEVMDGYPATPGSITDAMLADGAVTGAKLADSSVRGGKIADGVIAKRHLSAELERALAFNSEVDALFKRIALIAVDAATLQVVQALGYEAFDMAPDDMTGIYTWPYLRLCWISSTTLEVAPIRFYGNLQTQAVTLYAKGNGSMASGVLGVDTSWTITAQ